MYPGIDISTSCFFPKRLKRNSRDKRSNKKQSPLALVSEWEIDLARSLYNKRKGFRTIKTEFSDGILNVSFSMTPILIFDGKVTAKVSYTITSKFDSISNELKLNYTI